MNYFKKMVLLPIDEFNKYKNVMYASQVTSQVNPMQSELNRMKDVYGSTIPDDQRVKLESEIVQKYSEKIPNKEATPIQIDPSQLEWIKSTISKFAKTNKGRASRLYEYLLDRVNNGWNQNGELLTTDGEVIRGSNILDLINFVTATNIRKHEQLPRGMDDFRIMVHEANVPLHMLSKNGIKYIGDKQSTNEEEDFSDEEIIPSKLMKSPIETPKHKGSRFFKWDKHE